MTDVRIAEINNANKFQGIWLYKNVLRPRIRVKGYKVRYGGEPRERLPGQLLW